MHKIPTMAKNHFNTDIVLALYPYICSTIRSNRLRTIDCMLLTNFIRNKLFILYVVDLPIHQNLAFNNQKVIDEKSYLLEKKIFKSANKICVFNENMKKTIQEYTSIEDEIFIEFEILDYGVRTSLAKEIIFKEHMNIVYAGNLNSGQLKNQFSYLPQVEGLSYNFFGIGGEWIESFKRNDLYYHGALSPEELLKQISSTSHFGLIIRDLNNTQSVDYHQLVTTSKFSAYTVAGLPILVPTHYSYISSLVNKYRIGYSFSSLQEIPEIVSRSFDTGEYYNIRKNCLDLGLKIKNGYFFKKAIDSALRLVE